MFLSAVTSKQAPGQLRSIPSRNVGSGFSYARRLALHLPTCLAKKASSASTGSIWEAAREARIGAPTRTRTRKHPFTYALLFLSGFDREGPNSLWVWHRCPHLRASGTP